MALSMQERIKDLRIERKLTLEQLAELTGLSRSALGSYESDDFKDISHYALIKLADIQIYIEGIASKQIQSLNAWVDVIRAEILEKYQPGEHDRTAHLLQAAHIEEGEYFNRRVHEDIDIIMKDLREAHSGRSDSASEVTVVDELKKDMEEVMNFKGSRLEQLIMLFCTQTKIKYHKLTEEEKQWLIRIAQKSELSKSHIPQRGKNVKREYK